jgi:hypothetical protein
MQKYKVVTGPLRMNAGEVVGLDEKQAHDRRHIVSKNKDGAFTLKQPCDFKTGDVFGYAGVLPRGAEKMVAAEGSNKTIAEVKQAERQERSEKNTAASLKDFNERNAKKSK